MGSETSTCRVAAYGGHEVVVLSQDELSDMAWRSSPYCWHIVDVLSGSVINTLDLGHEPLVVSVAYLASEGMIVCGCADVDKQLLFVDSQSCTVVGSIRLGIDECFDVVVLACSPW